MCILGGIQLHLFMKGIRLTSDLPHPGTPNGQPENEYIHSTRLVLVIYGIIVMVFLGIFFCMLCCVVSILVSE